MMHEERARHFACIKMHLEIAEVAHRTKMWMPSIVNFRDALSRLADLDAAFAAVERETLERAAEWHDERVVAFQELYDDDSRPDDLRLGLLWKRDAHEESAVAIRALAGQPQEATADIVTMLAKLRGDGWMVAAHNDYRLHGKVYTFWLFTNNDECRFIKGEGASDAEALSAALRLAEDGH